MARSKEALKDSVGVKYWTLTGGAWWWGSWRLARNEVKKSRSTFEGATSLIRSSTSTLFTI